MFTRGTFARYKESDILFWLSHCHTALDNVVWPVRLRKMECLRAPYRYGSGWC